MGAQNYKGVCIVRGCLRQRACAVRFPLSTARLTKGYTAPIGAFFCPEIRAFTSFGGEISSTVSKVLRDRSDTKMAVYSR